MPTRKQLANLIRVLSMDAVQKANSGHPGMPMGMADIAEVLWNDFLRHHPKNPQWFNRDRFVVSNGHGCMLLYALLHLTGYDLTIEDIKQFRQLHSKTPGHPEYNDTPGVETTTGPLGQGFANAVGMAIAEKHLAAEFNREPFKIIDHFTYVIVGDGCLMEGISHEAASLAGTFGLGKLIAFYDDNQISIDGDVSGWFTDNTVMRFESYGWHVLPNIDGHDSEAIRQAILSAQAETDRPTLICCKTVIGQGAPTKAGTADVHGAALGETEIALARQSLDWPYPPFDIPQAYYEAWDAIERGSLLEKAWQKQLDDYALQFPALAAQLKKRLQQELPAALSDTWTNFIEAQLTQQQSMATRKASQVCLDHIAPLLPELMGGSADLTHSNLTAWKNITIFSKQNPMGRYIHYGVREFGMSAIMNGLALHGGIIPFGGTFLTFSDYARNAIRLSALMRQRVIYVYTHDSIGLGEDGPTHQPIEHIPSLRCIPQLSLWRPCDVIETIFAWKSALETQGPTCLVLSRQNLPFQQRTSEQINCIARGGYILLDYAVEPDIILIATGSEVALAIEASRQLSKEGLHARVVSMPSMNLFALQDAAYQEKVLPTAISRRLAIEAAASIGWRRWIGPQGSVLGIDHFGLSAPAEAVYEACGLTTKNILKVIKEMIEQS